MKCHLGTRLEFTAWCPDVIFLSLQVGAKKHPRPSGAEGDGTLSACFMSGQSLDLLGELSTCFELHNILCRNLDLLAVRGVDALTGSFLLD